MNIFLFPSIWLIIAGLLVFYDKPIWWLFATFSVLFGALAYGSFNTQSHNKVVKDIVEKSLKEGVEDED